MPTNTRSSSSTIPPPSTHADRVRAGVALVQKGVSFRDAEAQSGAAKETIRRALMTNGLRERDTHGPQRVNTAQEEALVQLILAMEKTGFPLRRCDVEASAWSMLQRDPAHTAADLVPLENRWFRRFVKRNKERLKFTTKDSLAADRTKGLSEENTNHFFSLLQSVIEEHDISSCAIFSMDETGVQHGVANKHFQYVVGASPRKDAPTARKDGSQDLTIVIECISADGYALPPAYVFKGRLIDLTLMFEETEGGFMTASDSGWTNTAISQHWIEKVFLQASKELSQGSENRLLIMVGKRAN